MTHRSNDYGPYDNLVFPATLNAGVKLDEGKLPYDLIPPELLSSVAKVLQFGAKKYAPRNWEKGMDWGRVFSALQRHLWAWQSKEEADPETGFSHLEHAACCIAFLLSYEQRRIGVDDRYTPRTLNKENPHRKP